MIPASGKIIYNADDPNAEKLVIDSNAKKYSYGTLKNAQFRLDNIEFTLDGTTFNLEYNNVKYDLNTSLVGHFNAYNAASAFSTALVNGISAEQAIEGIRTTPQVPGRFEVVSEKDKKVIIDYSHTSDSLKQALTAVHHIVRKERPVYTIFGCGGDRDRTKRPVMGQIAASMSKKAFVTSDNPRTENPFSIIDEVVKGINTKNYSVIENREEAIRTAIFESEDNAVILVAGKGHENYQEINGVRRHFSDKETAKKYLAQWAK